MDLSTFFLVARSLAFGVALGAIVFVAYLYFVGRR